MRSWAGRRFGAGYTRVGSSWIKDPTGRRLRGVAAADGADRQLRESHDQLRSDAAGARKLKIPGDGSFSRDIEFLVFVAGA